MYYLCVYVCVRARSRAHLNGEHSSCNCNCHLLHLIGIIVIVFEFFIFIQTHNNIMWVFSQFVDYLECVKVQRREQHLHRLVLSRPAHAGSECCVPRGSPL